MSLASRPIHEAHRATVGSASRLRRHAGEYNLLALIVADLSEENLERAPPISTSRPNVAAVNGECNRFRRHRWLGSRRRDSLLLQPGANTKGSLPGGFHGLWLPSGRNSASSVRARR